MPPPKSITSPVPAAMASNTFQFLHGSRLRAIQIHEMESFKTGILELFRHFERTLVINFFFIIVALGQPHTFPVDDINGRYDLNILYEFKKFFNICSPAEHFSPDETARHKNYPCAEQSCKG